MASFSTANSHILKRVVTLDVSSVPANSVQEESFTFLGLKPDFFVVAKKPTLDTGLLLVDAQCRTKDVLLLTFENFTGEAINPASQDFYVVAL